MSEAAAEVRLVAYSDYLCPWCYNASVRLHRLEDEEPGVEVEWRSYLLRPRPGRSRDLDRFRAYTESWRRPAAEDDAGTFRVWASEEGPPSHSVPAQLAAKAAGELGREPFRRFHDRLLRAYFGENRDISSAEVLEALWEETGLPSEAFRRWEDPALLRRVLEEHEEALRCGATGVPSVRLADGDAVITGALPLATYQRWIERTREARRAAAD
jgi:predicted DsbA family dithiol-disulfide isomerase